MTSYALATSAASGAVGSLLAVASQHIATRRRSHDARDVADVEAAPQFADRALSAMDRVDRLSGELALERAKVVTLEARVEHLTVQLSLRTSERDELRREVVDQRRRIDDQDHRMDDLAQQLSLATAAIGRLSQGGHR